jgi:hypothetical protein
MKKLLLFFLIAQVVYCQETVDKLLYLTSNKIGISVNYQDLKIGDEKLSQLAFPVSLLVPVSNRVNLTIYNGSAMSKYESSDINGLGETRLGLRYIFPGEQLMVKGMFGLPSGKTKLDNEQFTISQLLSLNPLDYTISYYGQGFNANLSLAYAYPIFKSMVVGLGASYTYRGSFTPKQVEIGGGKFDPGDEISGDVGLDMKLSESVNLDFDVVYTVYSKDKLDNVEIYQLGNKISIYTGLNIKALGAQHNLLLIARIRNDNSSFSESSQDDLKTGSQIDLNYLAQIPISGPFSILIKAGGKLYKDSEQMVGGELFKTGEANIFGFGGGFKFIATDYIQFELSGEYKTGTIKLPFNTENNDISGLSIGFNSNFRF